MRPTPASRSASPPSEIRNPDGSVVFKLDNVEVPEFWSQVASDVLAQKYFRKAGVPARLKKVEENSVPSFLWRSVADEEALAALPEKERTSANIRPSKCSIAWPAPGPTGAGRAAISTAEEDAQAFFDELRYMLATQMCAPNSPQWFNTGLHWAYGIDGPSQGHYYVDFETGKLTKSKIVLRASAAARLLHPGHQRRPGQRRRHHGPVGARGAPVQIRLRHRLELLAPARRRRKAVGRRPLVRPDELPQDRRPRGGRHQVGRHHAARRQDGDRRRRSPRHRDLYRLEGEGRAEGGGAGHRLQDQPEAPQGRAQGLRELRGLGRRLLLAGEEPRA